MPLSDLLQRLCTELSQHPGNHAMWLQEVVQLLDTAPDQAYARLNSKRMWGGAGSIANEALADNPGMDETLWKQHIREFRILMIDLAEHLKSRRHAYPDIDFWLTAYINWNQVDA